MPANLARIQHPRHPSPEGAAPGIPPSTCHQLLRVPNVLPDHHHSLGEACDGRCPPRQDAGHARGHARPVRPTQRSGRRHTRAAVHRRPSTHPGVIEERLSVGEPRVAQELRHRPPSPLNSPTTGNDLSTSSCAVRSGNSAAKAWNGRLRRRSPVGPPLRTGSKPCGRASTDRRRGRTRRPDSWEGAGPPGPGRAHDRVLGRAYRCPSFGLVLTFGHNRLQEQIDRQFVAALTPRCTFLHAGL